MSDLIRRSELHNLPIYKFGVSMLSAEEYIKVSDIEKIPTAYDIDKVVEELNKLDVKAIKRYKGGTFGNYEGTDYYIKKSEAIEIVKQGGDDNDVCEWTKIDEEGYKNCKCNYDETIPDFFKYCPYCGKKIKAVK